MMRPMACSSSPLSTPYGIDVTTICFTPLPSVFFFPLALHLDAAVTLLVDLRRVARSVTIFPPEREIGAFHPLHQHGRRRVRVVDEMDAGTKHFAEVVGRDVGRHPDGDSGCAVHQEVRELGGQNHRFFAVAGVVVAQLDGFLVEFAEQSFSGPVSFASV